MGTAHLPGMQYLTGGAMAATAPSPEKNEAGFSLAQIQFLSKKRTDWGACHVTSEKAFWRGQENYISQSVRGRVRGRRSGNACACAGG